MYLHVDAFRMMVRGACEGGLMVKYRDTFAIGDIGLYAGLAIINCFFLSLFCIYLCSPPSRSST